MTYGFRLRRGQDLREAISAFAIQNRIAAAVPVACVGCLLSWQVRAADGVTLRQGTEPVEIVSLTGTVSAHGLHLHIALAREDLSVFGGHLVRGCIVNTTAEIVLASVDGVSFLREHDPDTGYDELVILPLIK